MDSHSDVESEDSYQESDFEDSQDIDDTSGDDNDNDEPAKKKGRGLAKNWVKDRDFENRTLALEFIKNQNCWSSYRNNKTLDGNKIYYRCNLVQQKSEACPASIYLLYYADREAVGLYRTQYDHDHDGRKARLGLDPIMRSAVMELYNKGIRKPKSILAALRTNRHQEPGLRAVSTFLHSYKKQKSGSQSMTKDQFEQWCTQRSAVPEEPDKAFVVDHISGHSSDGGLQCRAFMSTTRLLGFALRNSVIHADSTYKVNCRGFPAFIIGTSDLDRQFFPLGIGVCADETADDFAFIFQALSNGVHSVFGERYKPSALVADACDSITSGFKAVFGDDFKRIMCWTHVGRAVDKELEKIKGPRSRKI